MDDKTFIDMYHNDSELMSKIDDLKQQGIEGENIYVIAQDETDVTMFQGMKYGDVQTTPDSWFDRFLNFLTGENHVRSMLREAGVADHDMDNYYNEILNGGKLLYVDQGEINQLHTRGDGSFGFTNAGVDPNLGGNFVSEFEENELHRSQYGTSSAAFQDSNLHEGTDNNFGRVGGEALRKERDYETPPNNYYGVQNRYDETNQLDNKIQEQKMRLHEERLEVTKKPYVSEEIVVGKRKVEDTETVNESVKREEARLEQSGDVDWHDDDDYQDEVVDVQTMRDKWHNDPNGRL